jgi:Ca2+-dependent lipid-binding protein
VVFFHPSAGLGKDSDPFVKLELLGTDPPQISQSSTIPKTLNPEWMEEFEFESNDPLHVLRLRIYDKDRCVMPSLVRFCLYYF